MLCEEGVSVRNVAIYDSHDYQQLVQCATAIRSDGCKRIEDATQLLCQMIVLLF